MIEGKKRKEQNNEIKRNGNLGEVRNIEKEKKLWKNLENVREKKWCEGLASMAGATAMCINQLGKYKNETKTKQKTKQENGKWKDRQTKYREAKLDCQLRT